MKTSLVIPTWNAGKLFEEVLAAIDRQPGAGQLEKVAVDSGSTDGTIERLERHGFRVLSIPQRAFNHGATRDLGIEQTSGEVVLLLTQDATPADERWLPELQRAYEDPSVDAAWCRQVPRPGCNPILRQRIEGWMGDRAREPRQRLPEGSRLSDLDPMRQLWLSAFDNVASSVRRTCWERHRFGWRRFGEDVGFGRRVIESGGTIAFVPDAVVIHSHETTPRQEGKRLYCDHQNLRALFGLCVIPTLEACRRAAAEAGAHYVKVIDQEQDLDPARRAHLRQWAVAYAKWIAWGQYLGANHDRLRKQWFGCAFGLVDWWMHRP